ncbi:hypothetical protein [Vibrio mexicanus]|uniref:hypothetical protein n=1 Tax=Vibrio mexicanus TaxID=1004326 RepID=UPI00063CC181|nr:hypothetical protein [Vibrio mexicanus]
MTTASSEPVNESHEIVSFKYKEGVTFEEQKRLAQSLSQIVSSFKGFKSREFYYSEDNQRWFDHVVWETVQDAKAASEQVMSNQGALKVFDLMEEDSMIFSYYQKVGEVESD